MIEQDIKISKSIEKIEKLITELENNRPVFNPKTTCKFGEKNLKAMSKEELVNALVILKTKELAWDEIKKKNGIQTFVF